MIPSDDMYLSPEDIQAIKKGLEGTSPIESKYNLGTICIGISGDTLKYTHGISRDEKAMLIEIELKDTDGKTQVSGTIIEADNRNYAEDAKKKLEEIYREIIDKRASRIPDMSGSGSALITD